MSAPAEVFLRAVGDAAAELPADLAAVAALRRAWTAGTPAGAPGPDPEFDGRLAAWWRAERDRRTCVLAAVGAVGARTGRQVVGMGNLVTFERMPTPVSTGTGARWGYVANMFVLPAHRGRGIGRQILDALVDRATRSGCVRVVLAPSAASVPFYRRAGFGPADMLLARVLDSAAVDPAARETPP